MKLLLVLLFPLCAFSQLPAGKYLKVKDDASGTVSGTFNVGWATEVAASAAQLNANSSLIYQPLN